MNAQRGSALVIALMMLTFLMILGTALLTSVTLDVAIGENYRTETQLLYLAELGIEDARRSLLDSTSTPSQLLRRAAGIDGVLSGSRDVDALLGSADDIPFIDGGSRYAGKLVSDTSGKTAGRYYVFLRNDSADGITSLTDSNQVLTLLCVAELGNARKVLEVTVMKWRFPRLPASLVLAGSPVFFSPASDISEISGIDSTAGGDDRSAIGVRTTLDISSVLANIPDDKEFLYSGRGNPNPPPADVAVIDSLLDPRLRSPAGMERVLDRIVESATEVNDPDWGSSFVLGGVGSSNDYRIVVVTGDCVLESGTGYGILLVRGNLRMNGSFQWNGLILVIGQGRVSWTGAGSSSVSGGMFVMRTRADDRNSANPLGTPLTTSGPVDVDLSGTGNSFQLVNPGAAAAAMANQKFPYVPIAIREY